jgi:protein gp37
MANRMSYNIVFCPTVRAAYAGDAPVLVELRLHEPLRRKKPAVIGAQYMGDLFHEDVSFGVIGEIFATIIAAEWHTFPILTKRLERMLQFVVWFQEKTSLSLRSFRHIWLGVSVENQAAADACRRDFEATPAAVKFVSYEPALGPVDWTGWEFIDLLIFGGESGPGARPAHPDWFRNARDWAGKHGIARFFKQWGAWAHIPADARYPLPQKLHWWPDRNLMGRVGKKAAGRRLDGQKWNQMPNGGRP